MEFLQSGAGVRTVRLDPRTKIVLLFAVSTVLLLGGNGPAMFAVRTTMLLFPFALLAVSGRVRVAVLMLAAYLGTYALAVFAAPALSGVANAFVVASATVVSRFVPTLALAYFVFATTTVSEFMAADGAHAPCPIGSPSHCPCCSVSSPPWEKKRARSEPPCACAASRL